MFLLNRSSLPQLIGVIEVCLVFLEVKNYVWNSILLCLLPLIHLLHGYIS